MSMYFLAGRYFNLVGRGPGTLSSTSADALFPLANLYDGQPGRPFRFASAAAGVILKKDVNAITNPGFETSTLSGWTDRKLGTGTVAETTTAAEVHSGTKAADLTGTDTSNYGALSQDITVQPGELWKLDCWIRATVAGTGKVFLQNLTTGKFYSAGAWGAAQAEATSHNTTTYTNKTVNFTIEDYDTVGDDSCTLRITLYCDDGEACFDDVLLIPGVNFTSVHGHNLGPIAPVLASSDDDSAYTTRISPTVKRGAFYGYDSTVQYARYWRLTFGGTNLSAIYVGEWVLGRAVAPSLTQKYDWGTAWDYVQARHESAAGEEWRYNVSTDPARTYTLAFQPVGSAVYLELRDQLFRMTRGGEYPVVLVPYSAEADVVYGLFDATLGVSRDLLDVWTAGLRVRELPLPVVGL